MNWVRCITPPPPPARAGGVGVAIAPHEPEAVHPCRYRHEPETGDPCRYRGRAAGRFGAVASAGVRALRRRARPPRSIDIVELFPGLRTVSTHQSTNRREKEERKDISFFFLSFVFVSEIGSGAHPLAPPGGGPKLVGVSCLPSLGPRNPELGPALQRTV